MAVRPGPNQVGWRGYLTSLSDGMKLPFKEEIIPKTADKVVYFIAPVISATVAFTAFAVIPFGGVVNMFGQQTALQLTDVPVSVLVLLACSSMAVYGVVLAGTARPPVARVGKDLAESLAIADGDLVTVSTIRGSVTLPAAITDLPPRVVWLPTNSPGSTVRRSLGVTAGAVVKLTAGVPGPILAEGAAR